MDINITMDQLIVWLVIGGIAGFIVGLIVKGKKKGFGFFTNLLIGMTGAVVGGFIFDLLDIRLGFGRLVLSIDDLIATIAGAFILLIILSIIRK